MKTKIIRNSSFHSERFALLRKRSQSVNIVNIVNLLSPCCKCFVRMGKFTKQIGDPYMKFTKFTKYTLVKNRFFGGFLAGLWLKTQFCLKNLFNKSSLCEYMLTNRWYKVFLQRGYKREIQGFLGGCVNFVNLAVFEVHSNAEGYKPSVSGGAG